MEQGMQGKVVLVTGGAKRVGAAICRRLHAAGAQLAVQGKSDRCRFAAGDVAALIQALLKLIMENELRQQMGEAARVRALDLFHSQKITGEMFALYGKLLGRH